MTRQSEESTYREYLELEPSKSPEAQLTTKPREMFLCADACIMLLDNVTSGLVVYPAVIERNLRAELPFLATENMIMALVQTGVSRQEAHESVRVHSHAAAARVKERGEQNDLLERIRGDAFFAPIHDQLDELTDPKSFIGRSEEQVKEFVEGEVEEALKPYKKDIVNGGIAELHV